MLVHTSLCRMHSSCILPWSPPKDGKITNDCILEKPRLTAEQWASMIWEEDKDMCKAPKDDQNHESHFQMVSCCPTGGWSIVFSSRIFDCNDLVRKSFLRPNLARFFCCCCCFFFWPHDHLCCSHRVPASQKVVYGANFFWSGKPALEILRDNAWSRWPSLRLPTWHPIWLHGAQHLPWLLMQ